MPKYKLKHKVVGKPEEVKLGIYLYKDAFDHKMSLSQYLERIQPSKSDDKLDAFQRQLQRYGLVTKSIPEKGIYASTIADFFQADEEENYDNNAPLARGVAGVASASMLFPEYISRVARTALLENTDYDVSSLLATTRVIQSSTYKEMWIDTPAGLNQTDLDKFAMGRVGEFGTFPRVTINWDESAKSVYKRGVQVDISYEFQREASVDLLALVITRIMQSQANSLFLKALLMAFNGATVVESSTLDANAAGGVLTYEAWLKWTASFGVYSPSTYYMSIDTAVKVIMMEKPDVDPVALMASLKQGPISQSIKIARGMWRDVTIWPLTDGTLPDDFILTFDKKYALERIVQAGTDLQETERIITKQFTSVVISISDEVSVVFQDSRFVLHISA